MEIRYWCSSSGRSYVGKFIDKQTAMTQKVIIADLKLMSQYGYDATMRAHHCDVKVLQGNKMRERKIHELIVRQAKVSFRIFFVMRDSVCWLLHIFKKESNRTPPKELEIAYKRACDLDCYLAAL